MSTLELAIRKNWSDVEKLASQIKSILKALKDNHEIVQVEDCTFPVIDSTLQQRRPKASMLEDSEEDDDDEFVTSQKESATAKMKQVSRLPFCNRSTIFEIIESETFLVPIMDRWVWGTTVRNISRSVAGLPDLYLTIPTLEGEFEPIVYSYSFSVLKHDRKSGGYTTPFSKHASIPYQQFTQDHKEAKSAPASIPTGCKVWVTAHFSNPTASLMLSSDKIPIMVSLVHDKVHQWTRLLEIKSTDGVLLYNDAVIKRFQAQIYLSLARHQDCFKLERKISQGKERSPSTLLESFLTQLGFEPLKGTSMEILYTSPKLSLLHGFVFMLTQSETATACCSTNARTVEQMHLFKNIFSQWLRADNDFDKRCGFKGMKLSTWSTPDDLMNLLFDEIEVLSHLVLLNHKELESRYWLERHIHTLLRTDGAFKRFMKK